MTLRALIAVGERDDRPRVFARWISLPWLPIVLYNVERVMPLASRKLQADKGRNVQRADAILTWDGVEAKAMFFDGAAPALAVSRVVPRL
jgi:hypothetical protein